MKDQHEYEYASCCKQAHFSPELVAKGQRVEIEESSFSDPGPDWNKYSLYDEEGVLLATQTVDGY